MNSPYAGQMGGDLSARNAQASNDLQDQKAENAFQEAVTKASNQEAKVNSIVMQVVGNMKG